jgi:CheY-like chemotaxis protein
MPEQAVDVLVVEDNEIDVEAMQRVFRKAELQYPLHIAGDGVEALEMLRGLNGKPMLPRPCLILLDINMPRMDGFQFLDELRRDDMLKPSVVFMLTTSGRPADRKLAYDRNVAGYFLKENLRMLADTLKAYCHGNEFAESAERF